MEVNFFYDDVGDSSSESYKDVTLLKKYFYIFALSQFKLNIFYLDINDIKL